jgi:hypothetical protein
MNLAPILAFYLFSSGWSPPLVSAAAQVTQPQPSTATDSNSPATQSQGSELPPKPQAPAQSSGSTQPSPSSTGQAPNSPTKAQSPAKRRRHPKKMIDPDCSISPTPVNPAAGNSNDPAKTTNGASTGGGSTGGESRNANSAEGGAPSKPCPPPKKVVRDGGSSEPTIQLMPGTAAEQASRQRSTEELKAAIDENLKKIAGRELSPSQREMVNQIKQFMDESKTAVASGDPERGHNLAMKARLLSDELVKP